MAGLGEVFLYDQEVERVHAAQCDCIIFAAPGMGKTTMLRKLHELLKRRRWPGSQSVTLIRVTDRISAAGGRKEELRAEIEQALRDGSESLLIDDLEVVFNQEMEAAFRDRGSHGSNKPPVIVTTAQTVRSMDSATHGSSQDEYAALRDSRGLAHFEPMWLSAWPRQWEKRLATAVEQAAKRENLDVDASWVVRLVREASGGHPDLLGAAFSWCIVESRLVASPLKNGDLELASHDLTEHLAKNHGDRLQSAYDWIRKKLAPEAVAAVLELAHSPLESSMELPLADEITKSGLTIFDNGRSRIPCETIRRFLVSQLRPQRVSTADAVDSGPVAAKDVEFREKAVTQDGLLVWNENGRTRELEIPPAEWSIVDVLRRKIGKLVTVEEMSEYLHTAPTTVRSALQRLQKNLRLVGLGDILVNVPRRRYRLRPDLA